MKVLLLKDVFKLGRAGDVKKVAPGYGRNYLLPQGLAALATDGMLKQADRIRNTAEKERSRLNLELADVASQLEGLQLAFPVKAGETGKLYGSVTPLMIAEAITAEKGLEIDRKQLDSQPIKTLGVHSVHVRLTLDLLPEVSVVVYREGDTPESAFEEEVQEILEEEAVGTFADLQAELEAEEAEAEAEESKDEETEKSEVEDQPVAEEGQAGAAESETQEVDEMQAEDSPEPDSPSAEIEIEEEGESLEQE
jgi:large subunit ribosomal protein L9